MRFIVRVRSTDLVCKVFIILWDVFKLTVNGFTSFFVGKMF